MTRDLRVSFNPVQLRIIKSVFKDFSILSLLTDLIYLSPLLGKRDLQDEFNLEYNVVMSKLMGLAIRT
jgi:hypothetical protein